MTHFIAKYFILICIKKVDNHCSNAISIHLDTILKYDTEDSNQEMMMHFLTSTILNLVRPRSEGDFFKLK